MSALWKDKGGLKPYLARRASYCSDIQFPQPTKAHALSNLVTLCRSCYVLTDLKATRQLLLLFPDDQYELMLRKTAHLTSWNRFKERAAWEKKHRRVLGRKKRPKACTCKTSSNANRPGRNARNQNDNSCLACRNFPPTGRPPKFSAIPPRAPVDYKRRGFLADLPERRIYIWRLNASFALLLDHRYH